MADDDRFGHHTARHITQPHAATRLQTHDLDLFQQSGVGVEFSRTFTAREPQLARPHDHQWHGRINASDRDAFNAFGALACGKQMTGHRAPCVQKVQQDRSCSSRHTINSRRTLIGHAPPRGLHRRLNLGTGVDVVNAHGGGPVLRLNQALLDGKRGHTGEHVAAVRPGVHRLVTDTHLGKQIIQITIRQGGQ